MSPVETSLILRCDRRTTMMTAIYPVRKVKGIPPHPAGVYRHQRNQCPQCANLNTLKNQYPQCVHLNTLSAPLTTLSMTFIQLLFITPPLRLIMRMLISLQITTYLERGQITSSVFLPPMICPFLRLRPDSNRFVKLRTGMNLIAPAYPRLDAEKVTAILLLDPIRPRFPNLILSTIPGDIVP